MNNFKLFHYAFIQYFILLLLFFYFVGVYGSFSVLIKLRHETIKFTKIYLYEK